MFESHPTCGATTYRRRLGHLSPKSFAFEYDSDDDTILYILPTIPFPCERAWPSFCLRGGERLWRARAISFLNYSFGSS